MPNSNGNLQGHMEMLWKVLHWQNPKLAKIPRLHPYYRCGQTLESKDVIQAKNRHCRRIPPFKPSKPPNNGGGIIICFNGQNRKNETSHRKKRRKSIATPEYQQRARWDYLLSLFENIPEESTPTSCLESEGSLAGIKIENPPLKVASDLSEDKSTGDDSAFTPKPLEPTNLHFTLSSIYPKTNNFFLPSLLHSPIILSTYSPTPTLVPTHPYTTRFQLQFPTYKPIRYQFILQQPNPNLLTNWECSNSFIGEIVKILLII